jgi:hypothetical protein
MGGNGNAAALPAPSPQRMLYRCSPMPRESISQEKKIKWKWKEILFSKNMILPHFNVTSDVCDDLTSVVKPELEP